MDATAVKITWVGTTTVERGDAASLAEFIDSGARVPMRQREVYAICVVGRKTLEEAARELGISRPTVREHLYRLRLAAREWHAGRTAARAAA
jgi:DNA-directed RNA polymerase specialized sigma24 family protein